MSGIRIEPIGVVRSNPSDAQQVIEIYPEHRAGLHRIEELDELWVLFWLHQLGEANRHTYQVHPRGGGSQALYADWNDAGKTH